VNPVLWDICHIGKGFDMRAFVFVLIVLVAGFIGLGFYQNWFNLTVDKEKMKDDTNTAKDLAVDLFKGKTREAKGTVKAVEETENRFTLQTADDREMKVFLSDDSKFLRNKEAAKRADLKAGDEVTVKFRETKDGKKQATSVTFDAK
jgi:hypothetical protein